MAMIAMAVTRTGSSIGGLASAAASTFFIGYSWGTAVALLLAHRAHPACVFWRTVKTSNPHPLRAQSPRSVQERLTL